MAEACTPSPSARRKLSLSGYIPPVESLDATLSMLAAQRYVLMLDAGMEKCEERGEPLTALQRFTLLTAGQLVRGDWSEPMPEAGENLVQRPPIT
jgi:hypothetical protein